MMCPNTADNMYGCRSTRIIIQRLALNDLAPLPLPPELYYVLTGYDGLLVVAPATKSV
jgi:hypothetical protein